MLSCACLAGRPAARRRLASRHAARMRTAAQIVGLAAWRKALKLAHSVMAQASIAARGWLMASGRTLCT